jgi:GMP reductase|tara:strand:- start:210 stop:1247 length:1038 start_codon:yes stop_codon:yes gene_type:complete
MKKLIDNEIRLDFNDVLINPVSSAISLTRQSVYVEINWLDTTAYPIIVSNMTSTGTYKIANLLTPMRVFTFIHKEYKIEEHRDYLSKLDDKRFIAITTGVRDQDVEKTIQIISEFPDVPMINVDVANVYANMRGMKKAINRFRQEFPEIKICAGNVANGMIIEELVSAGANYIKVGIGSGAACKTRSEVGVGIPQVSAVMDCFEEATKHGAKIISDGGCVTAGDVCKAIAAGAEMVMIAGMVSKSEECDNIVEIDGQKYVNFYGLGSTKMYTLTKTSEQEYRPNEGRDLLIPCNGSIKDVIHQIQGGLRSVCTYVGAECIGQLYQRTQFVRVNNTINRSLEKYEQ